MSNKIYVVERIMGMDGCTSMFAFSSKETANKVCEMYNDTTQAGDYDFLGISELDLDTLILEDFKIETDEDGDTELVW